MRIATVVLFVLSGCVKSLDVQERACPCLEGWVCCDGADICVADVADCPNTACSHRCEEGMQQCADNGVQVCELQTDGCWGWSGPVLCEQGDVCWDAECRCLDTCTPGAALCTPASGFQRCQLGPDGCYTLSEELACGNDWTCYRGRCVNNCVDQCLAGARRCDSSESVRVCVHQATGCLNWSSSMACLPGFACIDGHCLSPECVDGMVSPSDEVCDVEDNDCDGYTDEVEFVQTSALPFGSPEDLVVRGHHLFAVNGYGLVIYDIAVPNEPALVTYMATPGSSTRLTFAGDVLVLGGANGLVVVDVTTPAAPVIVATVPLVDVYDLAADGTRVVAAEPGVLLLVDLDDVSAPVVVGEIWSGWVTDMAVRGDVAWIVPSPDILLEHLVGIDLSTPTAPVEVSSLDVVFYRNQQGTPYPWSSRLALAGGYAYMTPAHYAMQGTHLAIVDISEPAAPIQVGYGPRASTGRVQVDGTLAVLAGPFTKIATVNVENPNEPVRLAHESMPRVVDGGAVVGRREGLALAGGYVYSARTSGLLVIDVQEPASPTCVRRTWPIGVAGSLSAEFATNGMLVAVYVGFELRFYDPSLPIAQAQVASLHHNSSGWFDPSLPMAWDGDVFVSAVMENESDDIDVVLEVIDTSPLPSPPVIVGSIGFGARTLDVVLHDHLIYVALDSPTLAVVDITDPAAPTRRGELDSIGGDVRRLALDGDHLYLFEWVDGQSETLVVIDVSDPDAPTEVGRVGPSSVATDVEGAAGMAVSGATVVTATHGGGIRVYDVSDPSQPILAGGVNDGRAFRDATFWGSKCLVASDLGVVVLDLSQPSSPVELNTLPTSDSTVSLQHVGDRLFVNDETALEVYNLQGCR